MLMSSLFQLGRSIVREHLSMAAVLQEVRSLAINTSKNVKWHVIASVALAGSNAAEQVPHVLRYALQHDARGHANGQAGRRIAREIREGLVKAGQLTFHLFSIGVPDGLEDFQRYLFFKYMQLNERFSTLWRRFPQLHP